MTVNSTGSAIFDCNTTLEAGHVATFNSLTYINGTFLFTGGTSGAHEAITVGQYYEITFNGPLSLTSDLTVSNTGSADFDCNVTIDAGHVFTIWSLTYVNGSWIYTGGSSGAHEVVTFGQYYDLTSNGTFISKGTFEFVGDMSHPFVTKTSVGTLTAGTRRVRANIATPGGYLTLWTPTIANVSVTITNVAATELQINDPSGTFVLCTIGAANAVQSQWVEMIWDGSNWTPFIWGGTLT
jgi:hypothetical protein